MEKLTYKYGEDNIFDYYFMNDFTTVAILIEDGKEVSHLNFEDEDNFYCYSEDKTYTKKELFEKFNIEEVI
jgi:hypothetical protein